MLTAGGTFRAEVIPEDAEEAWRTLDGADELVEFYDPTDVFGDLADALAEAFPAVAPELERAGKTDADADAEAAESDTEEIEAEAETEPDDAAAPAADAATSTDEDEPRA
jgi:hypothetical protein